MRKLNKLSQRNTDLKLKQISFDSRLNIEKPFLGDRSDADRVFHSVGQATLIHLFK